MKKILIPILVVFSVCSFAQQAKHVVVLGFDGMSPNGILNAPTPNFDTLVKYGAHTWHARAVLRTSSSQNWASMIMGAPPNKHSVHTNAWELKKIRNKKFCGGEKGKIFPTIFGVLRQQNPMAKIACFYHWGGFARLTNQEAFDKLENTPSEDATAQKAAEYIKQEKPDFLFLHFDHVDHAGHAIGHGTPAYYSSVAKADSLAGVVINALKEAGIYDNTIILVTADHGGKKKGHGGRSLAEREIPWIISGPGIKKGFEVTDEVETFYTAPTIAKIFGITCPDCWTGKAVLSAFE